ncbi:MAG: hypothetical protein JW969_02355 [Spirochaetales bacterium]|nr:hypothetical protein [Spirochaetales bacterium]
MKKLVIILSMLLCGAALFGFQYYSKEYYYSLDFPNDWGVLDESQVFQVMFTNSSQDSVVMVTAFNVDHESTNSVVLKNITTRLQMKGKAKQGAFCQYNALRGIFTFKSSGMNLKADMVLFQDDYFIYVIMAYSLSNTFSSNQKMLAGLINSFKIHYDEVIYSNNGIQEKTDVNITETEDKTDYREDSEQAKLDNLTDTTTPTGSNEYRFKITWSGKTEEFVFEEPDYYSAMKEMQKIVDNNIWLYFKIDPETDPNYTLHLWSRFYQEMYNKNYKRVLGMVAYFKQRAKNEKWSAYDLADQVVKCIQTINYERPSNVITETDKAANVFDYFTPNEIAWYSKGDCDTKSLFIVSVLKQLGYDAVMYYSEYYGHAMAGLNINATGTYLKFNNRKYYFIESTYPGWEIGVLPPDFKDVKKWNLIPIK